jgi:hypothetical protein
MTVTLVVSVIAAAMVLVAVVGIVRVAWRTFHDNEEMVPGGSWGEQMLAAREGKEAPGKRKSRWKRRSRAG